MATYDVAFVRREISYERYFVNVEAPDEGAAKERVRLHYMEGDGNLGEPDEWHSKCVDCDGGDVVEVSWAEPVGHGEEAA